MPSHLAGYMSQHLMLVVELDFEHSIRKWLHHCRNDLYRVFLRHLFHPGDEADSKSMARSR